MSSIVERNPLSIMLMLLMCLTGAAGTLESVDYVLGHGFDLDAIVFIIIAELGLILTTVLFLLSITIWRIDAWHYAEGA